MVLPLVYGLIAVLVVQYLIIIIYCLHLVRLRITHPNEESGSDHVVEIQQLHREQTGGVGQD